MTAGARQSQAFPFTPSDGFILALDGLCHRAWGGCLSASTEIEIEGSPDRDKLSWLAAALPRRLPLLTAELCPAHVPLRCPCWVLRPDASVEPLPLAFHRLGSVAGDEEVVDSVEQLRTRLLRMPLHVDGRPPHVRIDVARHAHDRWLLIITWSHVLLDGVGIELLVRSMARLWQDPHEVLPDHLPLEPDGSAWQRFQDSAAVGKFFFKLSGKHFPSASQGRIVRGAPLHFVESFSAGESKRYAEALRTVGGDLMTVFFHAVIAARAHRALLHARGIRRATIVMGVPAQLRPKTSEGEPVIFQNHMTMLYYVLENDELDDVTSACRLIMRQNVEHLRNKHHLSFSAFLSLARHLPGRLMLRLVRWQQRGELVSLFHSWTGTFARGMDFAFGGRVLNGFHIPGVSAPPGSGLFFSDCQGRKAVVLSWVDSCLNSDEVAIMRKQWRHDLLGETSP